MFQVLSSVHIASATYAFLSWWSFSYSIQVFRVDDGHTELISSSNFYAEVFRHEVPQLALKFYVDGLEPVSTAYLVVARKSLPHRNSLSRSLPLSQITSKSLCQHKSIGGSVVESSPTISLHSAQIHAVPVNPRDHGILLPHFYC